MRYVKGLNGTNVMVSTAEYEVFKYIKARTSVMMKDLPQFEQGTAENLVRRGVLELEKTPNGSMLKIMKGNK